MADLAVIESRLSRPERPALLQALLGGHLVIGLWLLWRLPHDVGTGPRENHLALLGFIAPEAVWGWTWVYPASGLLFLIAGVLWWLRKGLAWTPAVTVLALLIAGSWRVQQELYTRHQLHATFAALTVLAAFSTLSRGAITESGDRYGATALVPRWVPLLVLFWLGWTYSLSGLWKLRHSGLDWADGVALRVWLTAMAEPENPLVRLLVDHPLLATLAQSTTLGAEVLALPGLLYAPTRPFFGAILLAFHLALEATMGLSFYANEWSLVVVALAWPLLSWRATPADPTGPLS